jgi:Uncharacterized conserved protein
LAPEKVYSSELHDGKGSIVCRHGTIPVPVPAVMEMLAGSGIPLVSEEVGTELVTPTGMALIKHMAKGFGRMPPMLVEKRGMDWGSVKPEDSMRCAPCWALFMKKSRKTRIS